MKLLLTFLLSFVLIPLTAWAQPVTVFAAASLTNGMKDAAALWAKQGHPAPTMSFGSSSTLARQIEQGAPANVFASADELWMDDLAKKSLIVPDTRHDLLGNELVLIVPASHPIKVDIKPGFDLMHILGPNGRLAVGDPAHVPVGLYAKQALQRLGVWDKVSPHIAAAADVRSGMLLVEQGEAPAGIVYATDAAISKKVVVAGVFPESSHDPISYPFAIVKANDTPDARAFLSFLAGSQMRAVWTKLGFKVQ
ncbi:MAG TPA: molybdate ABC transporter substrate-binding protein [Rhodopila sp.]|uniref:molybdate ABC transporter substrate-binding protein n=1 Tax=Rhodopila sp. TaxID=2480087 RepID=UPI002D039E13|nr:molybdate ABC transporter substrate-binding protein [Rhodopila sp.]HVY17354.1 molybdate ABC transporter substrate-binding protein [Rhodopila sp.]